MIIRFLIENGITGLSMLVLVAYLIVILSAIILHEISHGYAAYFNGDMTAKSAGRLTLNPMKHLTPIGTLLLFVVGFVIFMISVILLYKDNKILEDSKNLIIEGKADVITIIIMTYVLIFMLVICLIFDEVIGALLFGLSILIQSIVNSILINYYNKSYKK